MKIFLLSFSLLLLLAGYVPAQQTYTYLTGQQSPFNGEFNEPRLVDVDSITKIYYENDIFVDFILLDPPDVEEIPGFTVASLEHILLKKSADGLSDTLSYYDDSDFDSEPYKSVRKYANDGKLVYSSESLRETKYIYDAEERISRIYTFDSYNGAYDTVKYDYENQMIYTKKDDATNPVNDSIFVFYNDSGYITVQEMPEINSLPHRMDTIKYVFDAQNRLSKRIWSYGIPEGSATEIDELPEAGMRIYKYTDDGYEAYQSDGEKVAEYRFQSDGYCMEYHRYRYLDATTLPGAEPAGWVLASIEKFSYYKDGEVIVKNDYVGESNAPKAYGVQGGVVVDAENPVPVRIYSFSGSLVKQQQVSAGSQTIPLPKGLYVVVIGQMSYKIRVQ